MSDFAKERRQRARAGSLLDHVGSPQPDPALAPDEHPAPRDPLLSVKPRRSPRVSTSQFAARPPAPAANPAKTETAEPDHGVNHPRGGFGDRIAQLIGKVAPRAGDPAAASNRRPAVQSEPPSTHRPDAWPEPGPEYQRRSARSSDLPPQPEDHYAQHPHPSAADPVPPHHPASMPEYARDHDARPLLDASILMAAVWRFRYLIVLSSIVGAVIGVLMALATPHKYYAESRLFLDPREIRLTEDDIRNQQLSTEAMLAIIDSQLQILSSTSVLQKVVDDLGLDRDPEFNGSQSSGGIGAGINLIRELVSGRDTVSESTQKALEELRHSLSVTRDSKTFVIIVGVDTHDPQKSALIANKVVNTYLDSEGEAQSGLLERTSESIDTRLNALRQDLDEAERAVERFKAENGIVGVAGQNIDDKVILAISEQLANARAVKVGIRVKAQNLAKANPEDVLSGAFPEEYLSSNLVNLRRQYAETKATADALATRLGPRHPQYVSAKSSLDTTRSEIVAELRRIVASSQLELQRAVETEQELASQMAVAKSRAMDQSVDFVTLRELERKATATREIYEAFLKRSRETSERSNLSTRNIRVISPAEPPLKPAGPSRKLIAIGGMATGFFAGLGLALLAGAVESVRAFGGPGSQRPGGPPPFTPFPGAPGPSRRSTSPSEAQIDSFSAAADRDTAPDRPVAYPAASATPTGARTRRAVRDPAPAADRHATPATGRDVRPAAGLNARRKRPGPMATPDAAPINAGSLLAGVLNFADGGNKQPEARPASRAIVREPVIEPVAQPDVKPKRGPPPTDTGLEDLVLPATPARTAQLQEAPLQASPMPEAPSQASTLHAVPDQEAPVQVASVQKAPVKEAPVRVDPVHEAPAKKAPVKEAPVQDAPVQAAPVQAAPALAVEEHTAAPQQPSPQVPPASDPRAPIAQPTPACDSAIEPNFRSAPEPHPTPQFDPTWPSQATQPAPPTAAWQTPAPAPQTGYPAHTAQSYQGHAVPPIYPAAPAVGPQYPPQQPYSAAGLVGPGPGAAPQWPIPVYPHLQHAQMVGQPSPLWPGQVQPGGWPQPAAFAWPAHPVTPVAAPVAPPPVVHHAPYLAPQFASVPYGGSAPAMPYAPVQAAPPPHYGAHPGSHAVYPAPFHQTPPPPQPTPPQPATLQPAPLQPTPPQQPDRHAAPAPPAAQSQAVERIWRDVNQLRSRIGGYHGARRRA